MSIKSLLLTGALIATIASFIVAPQLLNMVVALVFMGAIPFTNYSIPPLFMLFGYPVIMLLAIFWVAKQPQFIRNKVQKDIVYRSQARKKISKTISAHKKNGATTTNRRRATRRHYKSVEV